MRFSILPVLFLVGCSSSSTAPAGGTDAGSGGTTSADSGSGGSTNQTGGAGGGTAGSGGKTGSGGTAPQKDGGSGGSTSPDASSGTGGADSGATSDSGAGPDAAPVVKHTLKIENYLSWCAVTVNGGTSNTDATVTISVPEGTVVSLGGDKASATFVWGYWRGTSGDTTASHDTQTSTTVTMDADKTVQACCPFASDPTTPCPDPT